MVVSNLLQSLLVPLVVIVGLIVLIALHDVAATVGIPVIVGFAGVHLGANLPTPSGTTAPSSNQPHQPVIQ